MKKLLLLLACFGVSVFPLFAQKSGESPFKPERHVFLIRNFHTESGIVLPEARVVYGTYGHMNAAHDNVILLPSHYMADLHGYEWLMGPGHALDLDKYFLVTSELFGNGNSSSPSNTPEPLHGPRFPVTTIRDNVEAVHQLPTTELGVPTSRQSSGFRWAPSRHSNGLSPTRISWTVSWPLQALRRLMATASCDWRARSPR